MRTDAIHEALSALHARAALGGRYLVAHNDTWGTGVKLCSNTGTVFNVDDPGILIEVPIGARPVVPDFIRLVCTSAGAASTQLQMGMLHSSALRYDSGGELMVQTNAASNSGVPPTLTQVYLSKANIVVNPAGATRRMTRAVIKPAIVAVNDSILITFGGPHKQTVTGQMFDLSASPVVIGAGTSFSVHLWGAAMTTAPAFEVSMGWWEL